MDTILVQGVAPNQSGTREDRLDIVIKHCEKIVGEQQQIIAKVRQLRKDKQK